MPGNEVEDRVHNFFAQEDLSSDNHQSQAADGSWQGPGSNLWPGSQMHIGLPSSNPKGYNIQQSDIDRGQNNHSFQVAHGLNYGQPTLGSELAKNHSQSQLPNSNGYMHGHQMLQTRQDETNFLGMDTESDRHTETSRGRSIYESEGRNGLENNVSSVRPEPSESRIGFDFLGGQQQMSRQQIGMLQSLPQQLSGFNNMQQFQQQVMLRKVQELQRQQLEAMHNNSLNQSPSIINGTPISAISAASNNTWPAGPSAGSKSWLHRATQAAQGASNDLRFSPEQGQTLSLMGSTPQQADQSLYGVPVSNTRGNSSHFSHASADKHPMQHMAMYSNSSPGDQYRGLSDQVNVQDRSMGSRQGFQEENFFGQPSGQSLDRGMYSGKPQLAHSLQIDSPLSDFAGPSEILEGKKVLPVASSQNAVALDPTEEKILFGNGNIWDSFGDSANVGVGGGSWSALMQSAVGETSSNDIGIQEEWSDPNIQNTEVSVGPLSDDINVNKSFQGVPGFQQTGQKYPSEYGDRQQMDSTHRSFQHFSEEGSKWSSGGALQTPPAERTQIYQNTTSSSDAIIAKSMLGSWSPHENDPSHFSGQIYGKPNGRDNTPSSGNEAPRFYGNESMLQQSGSNDQLRMLQMSQGVHMWKQIPGPQSTGGLEQARTGMGSPQVNREDGSLNNHLRRPSSSTGRASEGASPNSVNPNLWKHAEYSKVRKGNEPQMNKGPLVLESSMNGSGNDESNERKENSSESHHSNMSQHTTAGGSNDKVWLDGSNTRNLLGGKQKAPKQGGQKVSGPRKFQYHPMGNFDEDAKSSSGKKSVSNNQSQGYSGQSNCFGQLPKTSSEMDKGHMFGVQQNKKGEDDSPARGTVAGFAPNVSQSSQNVFEFPRNMDQSKENSNSEGTIGPLKQSQSPSSHGFGLRLGFPSQLLPAENHALSANSSAQSSGPLSSAHITSETRENVNTSQAENFSSLRETTEGELKRNGIGGAGPSSNDALQYGKQGNLNSASTSGFPLSRNQLQGQVVAGAVDRHDPHSVQTGISLKDRLLSRGDASQHTDAIASRERVATQEVSLGRTPKEWTKPPSQQNFLGGQPHNKFPPGIFRQGTLNKNVVSAPSSQQAGVYGEGQQAKRSLHQLVPSPDLAPKPSVSQGKESVIKNQSDASPSNSASTESDFEAFGRSLKPSNLPPSNYSLLNQMRAMKSTDIDPSSRGLKRFKGAESGVGSQMRQSSEQNIMVGDPKNLSFSGSAGSIDNNNPSSLCANVRPQEVLTQSRMESGNYHCNTSTPSLRVEHSQVSPQMAPSWFEQYGTFKNGQMLSMFNAHKQSTLKTIEQRLPLGKSSDTLCADSVKAQATAAAESIQAGNIWQRSIPASLTVDNIPSAQVDAHDVTNKGLTVARIKKRKIAAPRLSWNKEVTQGSQSLLTISAAEVEWSKAANRLIDKVEDEVGTFEDGPPSRRSKRRLITTTQLMQQLFRPPAAGILSADAYSNYEAVACMSARLALGDSCSLMPCSNSDSCAPLDSVNSLTDKNKTSESERISDRRPTEVMVQFIDRAKKLENDFTRLDKRASVVDLRVESQDLDKISVINRFARVHGRGQADVAPPGPQRYVNAWPSPKVLPERVQCLPL